MVMGVGSDIRRINGVRDPENDALVRAAVPQLRALQLALAKASHAMDQKGSFLYEGASSIHQYALMRGLSFFEALDLPNLGKALEAVPDLEKRLNEGRLSLPAACELGKVLGRPHLSEADKEAWLLRATTSPFRAFKRAVKRAVEEERQQATSGLIEKSFFVREQIERDFE